MIGYLNVRQAAEFLGGRSISWMRLHMAEIPHLKLYDRLLFDPAELRVWIQSMATRHVPVDVDAIVREAMTPGRKRRTVRNAA